MPVAKLSERFYQKFGHDLVEELVTWLNEMDSASRTNLRELNELNFARFDAKLEQRASELDAKIDLRTAELRRDMAALRADMIKWMFVFWAGNVATTAGLMFAFMHLMRP